MIARNKRAYSYIRFSTGEQAKGSSLKRQLERSADWCKRNNVILDDTYRDLGVSAFKGKNRTHGALATFLSAVKEGEIQAGSILIVESLDRLSRQEIDEALDLFRSILRAGIEIITLSPERHYNKASLNDVYALIEMMITAQRAREEQERKAERIANAWVHKRKDASAPLTSGCPAWLRINERKTAFVQKPDAVKTVRLIYKLCLEGFGCKAIASYLNKNGIAPIGHSKAWNDFYVRKVLTTRAVLGEYQPHTKHKGKNRPIGDPVEGYYPAIIPEATWHKVHLLFADRKRTGGPAGKHCRNLFTGIAKDARDGSNLQVFVRSGSGVALFVSANARVKVADRSFNSFHYEVFEKAFLTFASELKPADIMPKQPNADSTQKEIDETENELAKVQRRREQINRKIAGDDDLADSLFDALKELGHKEQMLKVALLRLQAEKQCVPMLSETQRLIDYLATHKGDDLTAIRHRLKAKLKVLLAEIIIHVIPHNRVRLAVITCQFTNGTFKTLFVCTYWGRHLFTFCQRDRQNALVCDLTNAKDRARLEHTLMPLVRETAEMMNGKGKPATVAKDFPPELVNRVMELSAKCKQAGIEYDVG